MSDSVEFRHLEYLVAIDERKNFTKAAEQVYRSQPAVSQQIRGLEADIGFPVFERHGRDGVTATPAGELVLGWARTILAERSEVFAIARAIHRGEVPPLRMGFSSFVNQNLLTQFRQSYSELFPKCEVVVSGSDSAAILQRLSTGTLDCMRSDDALASHTHLDLHEVAPRIRVFRDPDVHPSAHAQLVHLFAEAGIPLSLGNSVSNKADIQWMVRENYGLALIDETLPLEAGLTTRPIAGVNWSVQTAFVAKKSGEHIALSFILKFLRNEGLSVRRKGPRGVRPQATKLKLIG
jgi:LysR family hydrogen peroxide-inducible transcriptional activator